MKRFAIIAIAFAMLVPAAFAQKVRVDFNKSHDFSSYRTYAWKGCGTLGNDTLLKTGFTASRIQSAVNAQLTLKEMREVPADANPDVYFTCWMSNQDRTEVWSTGWGPGWGGGYWGWYGGWGGYGHSTVNTTHYTEATYVIDMIDATTESLVWRAHSTMTINHTQRDAKRIEKMAQRAFKKFPAGPAATATAHALRPDHALRPEHAVRGG